MSRSRSGEGLPAGVFHLISAHGVVPRWNPHPRYYALCGAVVATADLPEDSECPNECGCEALGTWAHCPDRLRAALQLNRLAGVETGEDATVAARG